jgi:hypothetical protein
LNIEVILRNMVVPGNGCEGLLVEHALSSLTESRGG